MPGHEPLIWDRSYETGVSEIDDQHRILVNTLNEANARLSQDSSLELLEQITRDLLSYALYHFETEEEMMRQFAYENQQETDALQHFQEHRQFSATVVAVRENLKMGTLISREELLSFLNNWLVTHILNTDMKLANFLLDKQAVTESHPN